MENPSLKHLEELVIEDYDCGVARTLNYLLINQTKKFPSGSSVPSAQIIDRLLHPEEYFSSKQFQAYLFDTLGTRIDSVKEQGFWKYEALVELVVSGDYLTAYCDSRGIDSSSVTPTAMALLKATDNEYRDRLIALFGCRFGNICLSEIKIKLAQVLAKNVEHHTVDIIRNDIERLVTEHVPNEMVIIHCGIRTGIVTHVAQLCPRRSYLFLDSTPGLESHRAAYHALGHVLFAVSPNTHTSDLLGVNIAATEVVAFQAQEIFLENEPNDVAEYLYFMQLFHSRLYALRVMHDQQRWLARRELDSEFASLTQEFLGVTGLSSVSPTSKLVAVDFLFAFGYFYKMPKRAQTWKELVTSISNLDNTLVLSSQNALCPLCKRGR